MQPKTKSDLEAMSGSELVSFYNQNSDKAVKKFTDKKTAVRRCAPLLKVVKKSKRTGVGQFIRDKIDEGLSNEDILLLVKKNFPTSKATMNDVYWHRCKVRKEEDF